MVGLRGRTSVVGRYFAILPPPAVEFVLDYFVFKPLTVLIKLDWLWKVRVSSFKPTHGIAINWFLCRTKNGTEFTNADCFVRFKRSRGTP